MTQPEDKPFPRRWLAHCDCGCDKIVYDVDEPVVGAELYCQRHRRVTVIEETFSEYNVRCLDCQSRKWFGLAKLSAQMFASKHSRGKPTHRVQIRRGTDVIEIRTPGIFLTKLPKESSGRLPNMLDLPPF